MSMDEKYDAACDLVSRMDPTKVEKHLQNIISLEPELAEGLLSTIDVPLTVKRDSKKNNKEFLCCDYNRDLDSYRSPWSNEYFPELSEEDAAESPFPSKDLRALELLCNDSFELYRDLYYEGGLTSTYLWNVDVATDFSGVVLFKKADTADAQWDSIHVIAARLSEDGTEATYEITTTVILQLHNLSNQQRLLLSGNLTRETVKTMSLKAVTHTPESVTQVHASNIGSIIEDIETKLRSLLEVVYFEKTMDIYHVLRDNNTTALQANKQQHSELIKNFQNL